MVIFSIYENFAVEVVNGQHFLACLGVREYWWVFVWELTLLLGVRGYSCFLKISGSVHGLIWVSCLNIDLAFVGCSCGDWLNFWVFVDDRVFYKYPRTFDGFASRSRGPILVSHTLKKKVLYETKKRIFPWAHRKILFWFRKKKLSNETSST